MSVTWPGTYKDQQLNFNCIFPKYLSGDLFLFLMVYIQSLLLEWYFILSVILEFCIRRLLYLWVYVAYF